MGVKLVVSALHQPNEEWAKILFRKLNKFHLAEVKGWSHLPPMVIFFDKQSVLSVGFDLLRSIMQACNRHRACLLRNPLSKHIFSVPMNDSIWWSGLDIPPIPSTSIRRALVLHKKGLKTWSQLWDPGSHSWKSDIDLSLHFKVKPCDIPLIRSRIRLFPPELS
ncbi:hypothetical protein GOP47_0024068 [Adiantum capillus-veneris]|uniref:Uncharacterized protein n=1 Tax=Adiantum capillus-veneris TaxID=13818 RepID=A0A9D4U5W6_ADICA|nr:hypothetical protein GOP47_0024068 [Adiantum capillus-veneris]